MRKIIEQLGTGNYYFRVKTNASANGYFRESEWALAAEAYSYTGPSQPDQKLPLTGDEGGMGVWAAVLLLLAGSLACFYYKKKSAK